MEDGDWITIPDQGLLIGRSKTCDVVLDDVDASRRHTLLRFLGGALWAIDEGSTNGTLVDGEAITRRRIIAGTRILIGSTNLEVRQGDGDWPDELWSDWQRFENAVRVRSMDAVEALRVLAGAEDCRAGSNGAVAINWAEGERGMDGLGPLRMRLVQKALGILAGIEDT